MKDTLMLEKQRQWAKDHFEMYKADKTINDLHILFVRDFGDIRPFESFKTWFRAETRKAGIYKRGRRGKYNMDNKKKNMKKEEAEWIEKSFNVYEKNLMSRRELYDEFKKQFPESTRTWHGFRIWFGRLYNMKKLGHSAKTATEEAPNGDGPVENVFNCKYLIFVGGGKRGKTFGYNSAEKVVNFLKSNMLMGGFRVFTSVDVNVDIRLLNSNNQILTD